MQDKTPNVCCIFNLAPHYRSAIYTLMDKELHCDFYFGDQVETPIKLMDVASLSGYKKTVRNVKIFNNRYTWQKNVVGLVFKNYKHYILTGDHKVLSNLVIAFFAWILNKKVYLWMHGLKSKEELYWKEKLEIYPLYHLAYKFLLYGNYSRNIMINKGFDADKMLCIYNSLDYDVQFKIRQKLVKSNIYADYFKNDKPVLIYVGRIQKIKKIDLILISMLILKQRGIDCNLVIVGDNSDDLDLTTLIRDAGLESNVWIYGPCYNEEITGELIYNADVCVSPGNVGLTAMHCFVYGTPVITNNNFETQMPEFEVIEKDSTGDFFEQGNVWDLANKITGWIGLDNKKRENIRLKAFEIIDNKYNPNYQIQVLKTALNA